MSVIVVIVTGGKQRQLFRSLTKRDCSYIAYIVRPGVKVMLSGSQRRLCYAGSPLLGGVVGYVRLAVQVMYGWLQRLCKADCESYVRLWLSVQVMLCWLIKAGYAGFVACNQRSWPC